MAKLAIRCPGQAEIVQEIQGGVITIGRGRRSDICLPDPTLSRSHCRLERIGTGYRVVDLGSQNGTKVNGRRIQCPQALMTGDFIAIGQSQILYVADLAAEEEEDNSIDPGQTIMIEEVEADALEQPTPAKAAAGRRFVLQYLKAGHKKLLPLGQEALTIGRHKSCGLVFADHSVSVCHARIDFEAGQYIIRDLGSTNGVLINGQKVHAKALRPGMRIKLGKICLGFKELVSRAESVSPAPLPPSEEEQSLTPPLLVDAGGGPSNAEMEGDVAKTGPGDQPFPPTADAGEASSPLAAETSSPPRSFAVPARASRRGLIVRLVILVALFVGLLLLLLLSSGDRSHAPLQSATPPAEKTPNHLPPPNPKPASSSSATTPSHQAEPSASPSASSGDIIF